MSKSAEIAGALLDFGLDSLQSFVDPGAFSLVAAGLEGIDYAWDEGERALAQVLEFQEQAVRLECLQKLQTKLAENNATFDREHARLQKELDDAQAEGREQVRQVKEKLIELVSVYEGALDTQQKTIDSLRAQLNKGGK